MMTAVADTAYCVSTRQGDDQDPRILNCSCALRIRSQCCCLLPAWISAISVAGHRESTATQRSHCAPAPAPLSAACVSQKSFSRMQSIASPQMCVGERWNSHGQLRGSTVQIEARQSTISSIRSRGPAPRVFSSLPRRANVQAQDGETGYMYGQWSCRLCHGLPASERRG